MTLQVDLWLEIKKVRPKKKKVISQLGKKKTNPASFAYKKSQTTPLNYSGVVVFIQLSIKMLKEKGAWWGDW